MGLKTKILPILMALGALILPVQALQAQPVFDLPVSDFTLPPLVLNQNNALPNTLQVGDLETGIINPITGEPLNDVAFVFNPLDSSNNMAIQQTIRFFTVYHTSATDTRALTLSAPADLIYPQDNNIFFDFSSSVQILDLNRDGQNDLAFNGNIFNDCIAWQCGPAPIAGALGTPSDPFVGGNVDMLGKTIQNYSFPFFTASSDYGGQPSLASGDMNGDGNLDLVINDWRIPLGINQIAGAGNTGGGQMLRTFLNDGTFGPLASLDTQVAIPDPLISVTAALPYFVVTADFDMNGTEDAAVVYVVETADNVFQVRLMVYPGNGDGTFDPNPTISLDIAPIGSPLNGAGSPSGLTYGDFDGNGHLDFALTFTDNLDQFDFVNTQSSVAVVTCSPGSPPSCSAQVNAFPNALFVLGLDAGDFDGDGLDDIVQIEALCTEFGIAAPTCLNIQGQASVYLNSSGTFATTADQTIVPSAPTDFALLPVQVIAKDIDGCSPEDIAFTGVELPISQGGGGFPGNGNGRGIVAFATAGDPTADAGTGVSTGSGVEIGGNPTCFDPNGNPFTIQWTQISGPAATISDPTAANPLVTGLSGESTFQVTCQTACGQASDTVTITEQLYLEGSGEVFNCALSKNSNSPFSMPLAALGLGTILAWGLFRRRAKQ